jgi:hypothetical protein
LQLLQVFVRRSSHLLQTSRTVCLSQRQLLLRILHLLLESSNQGCSSYAL